MNTLKKKYASICAEYANALNSLWGTDSDWVSDDFQTIEVADCFISNAEMRFCVDNRIPFDKFLEWYEYDLDMHYGIELGKPEAHKINICHWFGRFPDDMKVPEEIRSQWMLEFLK